MQTIRLWSFFSVLLHLVLPPPEKLTTKRTLQLGDKRLTRQVSKLASSDNTVRLLEDQASCIFLAKRYLICVR